MAFKKTFDILQKKRGKQKIIQAAWICGLSQKELDKVFKSEKIFVSSFKNGVLVLEVENSILAGEVRLKSEELKNKINQKIDKELVEKIRTKIS